MRTNAISVANYLIDKDKAIRGEDLTIVGLVKLVYFVHGFTLAIYNKPAIDQRFDKVEAWKYGPIIPSVYHTFIHNGVNPITEKGVILDKDEEGNFVAVEPKLEDKDIMAVCDMVLKRYKDKQEREIVDLTHRPVTPWGVTYEEGKNLPIDDIKTRVYYEMVIEDEIQRV